MPISPEQLVISSIISNRDIQAALERGLSPKHFHNKADEFQFLVDHYTSHHKSASRFVFKNRFPAFPMRKVDDTAAFADAVIRDFIRRELTVTMKEASDYISDGDPEQAVERFRQAIIGISAETGLYNDGDIFANANDILFDIQERKDRFDLTGSAGITTGFPTWDTYTGGLGQGELWLIAARQGVGKSWIVQNMALAALQDGHKVLFQTLEQTRPQVSMRIYAMMAASLDEGFFTSEQLMRGKGFDMKALRNFIAKMSVAQNKGEFGNLVVCEKKKNGSSPLDFAALIEKHEPEVAFIDFIQRMKRKSFDNWGLAEVCEQITNLTLQYKMPIVAASQVNRDSTKQKDIGTENLGGSDKLGDDATVVMTIKAVSPTVLFAKNAKNRYGTGSFGTHIHLAPDQGLFPEMTEEEAYDQMDLDEANKKIVTKITKKPKRKLPDGDVTELDSRRPRRAQAS